MKRTILIFLAAAAIFSACSKEEHWRLVWTEDFEGPVIDETVWSRVENGKGDWNNMMSLREDLAYIENGQLVLLGKVNDGQGGDTTRFVTGGVRSKSKKSFKLAKFEIKAKFNDANGFWPALWLMPDMDIKPDYAEIDIMEHLNHDTFVYQTVHSYYSLNVNDSIPQHYTTAPINVGDFNVYGVEVYQDSLCFSVNDVHTLTYPRVPELEGQFPWSDYPFYFILSNQLEGKWVGTADKPEELPTELRVDWIKVYQKQ